MSENKSYKIIAIYIPQIYNEQFDFNNNSKITKSYKNNDHCFMALLPKKEKSGKQLADIIKDSMDSGEKAKKKKPSGGRGTRTRKKAAAKM